MEVLNKISTSKLIDLVEGKVYKVTFPEEKYWPQWTTILKFYRKFANGYCFEILCPRHLKQFQEAHELTSHHITYTEHILYRVRFDVSEAMQVLYGSK